MKKIISVILSIVMLIGIVIGFGTTAFSADSISYNFDSKTGTLTISGNGSLPSYEYSQYGTHSPYYNDTTIKKLVIGDGITSVGKAMFLGCSEIEEIIMPYNINYGVETGSINGYNVYFSSCFSGCYGVKKITFTKGNGNVRQFSNDQYGAMNIGSYYFPCSKTTNSIIFTPWYESRSKLVEVTFTEGITSISANTFYGCSKINKISIPNTVETIDDDFSSCSSLQEINVSTENLNFDSSTGALINKETKTLLKLPQKSSIKDYVIPEAVNNISDSAFMQCGELSNISISDEVTKIGNNSFFGCSNLINVTFGNSLKSIGNSAFENCTALESITLPESITSIGESAFEGCKILNNIQITDNIMVIDSNAFAGTAYFNLINNWNDGVLYIGNHLISVKPDATNVKVSKTCKTMSKDALDSCSSLANITFLGKDTLINCAIPQSAVIGGYTDSTAYAYAIANNRTFDDLSLCEHNDTYENTIKPTCTVSGKKQVLCSKCEKLISQTIIPATGHSMVIEEAEVAPTCTTDGRTEIGYCSNCDYVLSVETIPATGHTEVILPAVPATCTTSGLTQGSYCSVCKETLVAQETVNSKGHTTVIDKAVPATCTTDGKTEGSHCSVCGEVLVAQTIVPATGNHTSDKGTVTKAATYTATGVKTYKCTVCGKVLKTETIAKLSKKRNTLKAKTKNPTVKYSKLKKKNHSIAITNWVTLSKVQGKVTYKKSSGNKKITVSKAGKITVKKGLKKGTYKVKIKVTAAGNTEYNAADKTLTVKIKVK